jgi:murein DD-endopeptidase MepM/ murein hydrolase activator NlpD
LFKITSHHFHPVVQFEPGKEKIVRFDFTENNKQLQNVNLDNTDEFCKYISDLLQNANAKFGIGGYDELRTLYKRSKIFNTNLSENSAEAEEEPRRLHLGVDIWGREGTEIFAPCDGIVHSFAFNNNFGDYGATILLKHTLKDVTFFTLYGHLSLHDLENLNEGNEIAMGEKFAHFGSIKENGYWPPHLHFQVINDIQNYKGDYPGVCKLSERKKYLENSPDPDIVLNMQQFITHYI